MEIIIIIFGLIIGSFLNVLIYRLPRKIPFSKGRSFCPNCKKKIFWFDNIPLLSFIILKGKCRNCRKNISPRYPIVELVTGLLTILIFNQFFPPIAGTRPIIDLVLTLLISWSLIVVFFIDIDFQIIPDEILVFQIIILSLGYIIGFIFFPGQSFFDVIFFPIIAGIGSFIFLFLIFYFTKGRGMGFGDVKYAFVMGYFLGFPKAVLSFYLAFLTGAFIGIILIINGKAKFGQKIPFGPFLALSTFICSLWGDGILKTALKLLF